MPQRVLRRPGATEGMALPLIYYLIDSYLRLMNMR